MITKWMTLLLALAMLPCTVCARAAFSATASLSSANAPPGEAVEVKASLTGNPGLAAWMFELSWDAEAFALDTGGGAAQVGDAFASGTLLVRQKGDGGMVVSWFSARNVSADGTLFTVRLKPRSTAAGSYPVTLSCTAKNTINAAEQTVPVTCLDGSVTVSGKGGAGAAETSTRETGGSAPMDTTRASGTTEPAKITPTRVPSSDGTEALAEFSDVSQTAYYYDAVKWAVKNGVTNGVGGDRFAPNGVCSRAQTVTFLWRALGSPEPTVLTNPFKDVTRDSYYYKAVLWAVAEGVTNGTGADTFSPDATVDRAQTVTFLWRANGSPKAEGTSPFTDLARGAYYTDAVQWAVENKITGGTAANTFSPSDSCTRAQIVTFLYRNERGGEKQ